MFEHRGWSCSIGFYNFVLALCGAAMILLFTSRYGVGISSDSVFYVSAARNLVENQTLRSFDGAVFTKWPPLYPAVLAFVYAVTGLDPIPAAWIISIALFGGIVFLSGYLAHQLLPEKPAYAIVGTLLVVLSYPLHRVSVMAWSEPIFVLLLLLFLSNLIRFLKDNSRSAFIWIITTASLALLARYIGIALVFTGAGSIMLFQEKSVRTRLKQTGIFTIIASAPLAVWLARNYLVAGTSFGQRYPFQITTLEAINDISDLLVLWFLPAAVMIVASLAFWYVNQSGDRPHNREVLKDAFVEAAPIWLFAISYLLVLLSTALFGGLSYIDDKYLSPAYVPLILLIMIILSVIGAQIRDSVSNAIFLRYRLVVVSLLLLYSLALVAIGGTEYLYFGAGGYNVRQWQESKTLSYVGSRSEEMAQFVHSNAPDTLYILLDMKAQPLPCGGGVELTSLQGRWPESDGFFIWFDNRRKSNPCTVNDLQKIAVFDEVIRVDDGAVYRVSKLE